MSAPVFATQDYAHALQALMPPGRVWPRDTDSLQAKVLASFAPSFQRSGQAGLDLLVNAFPATALDLLPEWEATLGLPDPCAGESPTLQGRRQQVVARLAGSGGQSIPFFVAYAKLLGYAATVKQYAPFRCGQSHAGDPLAGQDWAFTWAVDIPLQSITYFRAGVSACGDALENWGNDVLECELQAIKPAQSILLIQAVATENDLAVAQRLGGVSAAAGIGRTTGEALTKTLAGATVSAALSDADRLSVSKTLGADTVSAGVRKGTSETVAKTLAPATDASLLAKGNRENLNQTLAAAGISAGLRDTSGTGTPTLLARVVAPPTTGYSSSTLVLGAFNAIAGQLIRVRVAWDSAYSITSITDTAGNTYTPGNFQDETYHRVRSQCFYCLSSAAKTGNVITINFNHTLGVPSAALAEHWQAPGSAAWSYDATGSTPPNATAADGPYNATSLTSPAFNTAGPGVVLYAGGDTNDGVPTGTAQTDYGFGSDTYLGWVGSGALFDGYRINGIAQSGETATIQIAGGIATRLWLATDSFTYSGGGNQPPVAAFTFSISGLTASFVDGSSDPDGTIASHLWDFGDGNTATTTNPSHTYAANGSYTVTLTVTDNLGATNSISHLVTVISGGGGGSGGNPDGTTNQPGIEQV